MVSVPVYAPIQDRINVKDTGQAGAADLNHQVNLNKKASLFFERGFYCECVIIRSDT
jgi:hypothetical protein